MEKILLWVEGDEKGVKRDVSRDSLWPGTRFTGAAYTPSPQHTHAHTQESGQGEHNKTALFQ